MVKKSGLSDHPSEEASIRLSYRCRKAVCQVAGRDGCQSSCPGVGCILHEDTSSVSHSFVRMRKG